MSGLKKIKSFDVYLKGLDQNPKINGGKSFIFKGHDLTKLASALVDFMSKNGVKFSKKEMPDIEFTDKAQSEKSPIFRKSGTFYPELQLIVIFITGRHIKDCLRSLAHELIHADQKINKGIETEKASGGILHKDKETVEIEADAYERGNLLFRKWEESLREKISEE